MFRFAAFSLACVITCSAADLNGDLLKAAAKDKKEEVDKVRTLLGRGANLNAQDKAGRTPLHWAVLLNHPHVVAVLLAHRADVNARDQAGSTALRLAATRDHGEIVKMLLDAKARTYIPESPRNSSERLLAGFPKRLHEAAANADIATLEGLLRSGVPVASHCRTSLTRLFWRRAKGHLAAVKILLAAGTDVRKQSKDGRTALHLAAAAGSLPLVELLAQTSIDLNARDSSKKTAADSAVAARSLPVLSFLLDRGVSVSDRDKALEWALSANSRAVAERLVTTVPTITSNDFLIAVRFGLSDFARKYLDAGNKPPPLALVLAARNGDVSLCELLLDKGANPNGDPGNDSAVTPLVAALREKHPETARLLLARGADPGIPPSGSGSPGSIARSAGYDDIAKTIEDTLQLRAARLQQRLQSLKRIRLSISVPPMSKVTRRGNDRGFEVDLTKDPNADEHWTPLVRRVVEEAVSSFGVVLVDTGQDADLNVTFLGYSAFSPSLFQRTSEELFSAVVLLNTPDIGPLHKYVWTIPFLSREDRDNYRKYFLSSGEANESVVLTDFKDMVKADLSGVLPPPAPKATPAPKSVAPGPVKQPPPAKKQAPAKAVR